jgi:GxxExxY protein
MEKDPLAYAVIGHAQKVHREIGPGIDEVFYHRSLAELLEIDGIEHYYKPRGELIHRGSVADIFEPDIVLPERLIPELKVLPGDFEPRNFLQIKSYLKFWKIRQGFLMDFGKESLVLRSYLYDEPPAAGFEHDKMLAGAPAMADAALVRRLVECIARVGILHGFGYRDTSYRGLLLADFVADQIPCLCAPNVAVRRDERLLGHTTLTRFLVVAEQAAILVLSQREDIRAADRAIVQTALRLLELSWGVIVHFGKKSLQLQWVLAAGLST